MVKYAIDRELAEEILKYLANQPLTILVQDLHRRLQVAQPVDIKEPKKKKGGKIEKESNE